MWLELFGIVPEKSHVLFKRTISLNYHIEAFHQNAIIVGIIFESLGFFSIFSTLKVNSTINLLFATK